MGLLLPLNRVPQRPKKELILERMILRISCKSGAKFNVVCYGAHSALMSLPLQFAAEVLNIERLEGQIVETPLSVPVSRSEIIPSALGADIDGIKTIPCHDGEEAISISDLAALADKRGNPLGSMTALTQPPQSVTVDAVAEAAKVEEKDVFEDHDAMCAAATDRG